MLRGPLAVVLTTLAATAMLPAAAGASSAQRFSDAALRYKLAIRATVPGLRTTLADIARPCASLPDRAPPTRTGLQAELLFTSMTIAPVTRALEGPTARFIADLDAIPTRDPALRSGRAAWRAITAADAAMPIVDRPCEVLVAWAATGYAPQATPVLPVAEYRAALEMVSDAAAAGERKLRRTASRMRRLGVPEAGARRFTGNGLFSDLDGLVTAGD